jgi:hypothetical protein
MMKWFGPLQVREPLPVPPLGVDLVAAALFTWLAWLVWKHGGRYRAAALLFWVFAVGGVISFLSGI